MDIGFLQDILLRPISPPSLILLVDSQDTLENHLKRREGGPKGRPSEASLNFFLECWLILEQKSQ